MENRRAEDWDPAAAEVRRDQVSAYDEMRERCPVAFSRSSGWTVFRHADVVRILHDTADFSSVVSKHVSVPNGMDPPRHTAFRALIEPYFTAERVAALEPTCREIAGRLVDALRGRARVELMSELCEPFAVGVQCAFLGWPQSMHEPLRAWTQKNLDAIRAQDRPAMAAVAGEFAEHVNAMLATRRDSNAGSAADITTALLHEVIEERPLRVEEIVSILRNWTMGEVGTIAAAAGIVGYHLATEPALQSRLRGSRELLPRAIDEMLRLDGPLVSNRRITTRAVEVGGRNIEAGERIDINWIAANRDPRAFEFAAQCRIEREQAHSLLYGAGIHACPGAALARMELRVLVDTLLTGTRRLALDPDLTALRATRPAAGLSRLNLVLE